MAIGRVVGLWPCGHDHASGAYARRGAFLIVLKILAAWFVISIFSSFAIAPVLSRRLRDANFPSKDNETTMVACLPSKAGSRFLRSRHPVSGRGTLQPISGRAVRLCDLYRAASGFNGENR